MSESPSSASTMEPGAQVILKADLHLHSAEDPHDEVAHSAADLLHRARELGFDLLAISLHGHVLARPEISALADSLGLRLIPAAELRLDGADVVILNITEEEARAMRTLSDLAALRARRGNSVFILAPHPFYILGGSIGARLAAHVAMFDAVEYCHFHTRGWNLNRDAIEIAGRFQKPLLATSDVHCLDFFGDHYSLVTTRENASIEEIFDSIRAGRVELVSPPWPMRKLLSYLFYLFFIHPLRCFMARL